MANTNTQSVESASMGPGSGRWGCVPDIRHPTRQRFAALVLCAIVVQVFPGFVQGQQVRIIDTPPQCTDCRIRIEKVSALGSEHGPGFVGRPSAIRQWGDIWAVTHTAKRESISLFAMNGRFIADMGRKGDGPGEFRRTGKLALRGDTLFVFDPDLGRVTAYASRTSTPITIGQGLPAPINFDVVADGRFLLSAQLETRDAAGLPLHFASRSGQITLSFGVDRVVVDPRMPHTNQRVQTLAPDGTIWTSPRTAYVLEQWDSHGNRLQRIERRVNWFKPHGGRGIVDRDVPPNPTVEAIWFDDRGLLWIAMNVADPAWKDAVYQRGILQGKPLFAPSSPNAYHDGLLEVVDVGKGIVVGHGRIAQAVSTASGKGWVVTYGGVDNTCECIEIWKPQLLRQAR